MFGGELVDGPLDAYYQADIINQHALEASGGKTYAELDREDPVRATMMNASFLRSSLFTSVIAFGVGLTVIAWLLRYVANHTFTIFVVYRLALAALLVGLLATGTISAT